MSENRLKDATSPYLLQHADNPVHWRAWGPEALEEARAANKPILLSIGYAACHWCHVMAHESFEDEAIAAQMNDGFIPIKVDREERPDIDMIYQQALALLGQHGGWPLTMFLTPEGKPFWGGTYFPPEPRYGRPGFPQVLHALTTAWAAQQDEVARNNDLLMDGLAKLQQVEEDGPAITAELLDQCAAHYVEACDPIHGGLAGAPRFPQPSLFRFLWRDHLRRPDSEGGQRSGLAARKALTGMSLGGIYDHLRGGWARYSTDGEWLVPHFEKMLYDNAQLVALATEVWQGTRDPLLAARVAETLDWIAAEMIAEGGGFAATLDADSEGEEGRFYVWTAEEIVAVLGPEDARTFAAAYDVRAGGNWEGKTILNRLHGADTWLGEEREAELAAMRAKLLDARAARIRPGWDDKVLADWNGLMIAAAAQAAFAFDRPDWWEMATTAYRFVVETLGTPEGRLYHGWRAGQLGDAPGMLDDYAGMITAALTLHELSPVFGGPTRDWLADASTWTATLDAQFWDKAAGGYFFTAEDAETLIVRTKSATDNATPSGNSLMVEALHRLYLHTGEARHAERARALIDAFRGSFRRGFFSLSGLMSGSLFIDRAQQVVLVGHADDLQPFIAALRHQSLPQLVLQIVEPGTELPPHHPAAGKGQQGGQPTAYICRGPTCSAPVTDAGALAEALA